MSSVQMIGVAALLKRMNEVAGRQAPFAMATAMTKTVRQAQSAVDAHILSVFDNPTPFTQRAVAISPATKQSLRASVFVKDAQAKYLQTEAQGGRRAFKSFEEKFAEGGPARVALPGRAAPLNQYGNLSKAKIKAIARDVNSSGKAKRFFAGKPKGHALPTGIYTRTNNNMQITPVIVFATEAVYEKRFKFSEIGMATINARYEANLLAAWAEAVKTARP